MKWHKEKQMTSSALVSSQMSLELLSAFKPIVFFFFFSNCFCSFVEMKNNPKLKDLWLRKEQFFHSTISTSTSKLVSHRANLENAFII